MALGKEHEELVEAVARKMRSQGLSEIAIASFEANYRRFWKNAGSHWIRESDLDPLKPEDLAHFKDLEQKSDIDSSLLSKTAILKLNGGLGTTMGLESAKSLLEVKNGLNFLDIIIRQTLQLRKKYGARVRLIFMNSFNTSADVMAFIKKHYPDLATEPDIELLQNKIPKVKEKDHSTGKHVYRPVEHSADPELEWCPPGHGDLYVCLQHSGLLDRLIGSGVQYLFVSNADNLGATLDLPLLSQFAHSKTPFLMEVAERTASDQKGGHLAKSKSGKLVLRESVQCHQDDVKQFQDTNRHRYFNTNNLWIKLDRLRDLLHAHDGMLPLPVIMNVKRVDPRDENSHLIHQYETAMGAAIEVFEEAAAIVVPRTRFAPVKTNDDLKRLRSDEFELTENFRVVQKSRK